MSNIKVLAIENTTGFGGAEIQLGLLAEGLNNNGIYFHVLSNEKKLKEFLDEKGVDSTLIDFSIYEMSNKKNFIFSFLKWSFYISKFKKILEKFRDEKGINTIYIASFNERIFLSSLIKRMGFKLIWMEHADLYDWAHSKNPLPMIFYKNAAEKVDKVISPSSAGRNSIINDAKVKPDKAIIVLNGIPLVSRDSLKEYRNKGIEIRAKLNLENKFLISSLSRLSPEKGQEYLLKAIKNLKDKGFNIYCLIMGKGPSKKSLVNLCNELNLAEQVNFLGFVSDKEKLAILSASDVFCFPSVWQMEGFGLVSAEAMMMNTPVIASRVGGIPDVIRDKENGILVEPKNVEQLSDKIELIYRDIKLRIKLAEKGREYVEKIFNADRMVRETKKILEEVLD
ncbi:hypothetical protein AUJ93_02775 [bacterium CG2_30_33_46]|nr:MAG: hypothetical protein AUJ93_02775 [bacterium CG2_30_33_46]